MQRRRASVLLSLSLIAQVIYSAESNAENVSASHNFLMKNGIYSIQKDTLVKNSSSRNGIPEPTHTPEIQKQCDKNHLQFLVQEISSPLPGTLLHYYGGFCATGITDFFQFLNGKIFLLEDGLSSKRVSNVPVGTYDGRTIHINILNRTEDSFSQRQFDASLNTAGQMEATIRIKSKQVSTQSETESIDQVLILDSAQR